MEDMIHVRKDIGDLGLCLPKESLSSNNEISTEIGSISRENIQKLISTCNPQLKENFLNCLRKNNKDGYEGSGLSRRYLRRVSPRHLGEKKDKDNDNDGSSKKSKSDSDSDKSSKDDSDSDKKSKKSSESKHKKAIIDAMVISALVTFTFAACLFLCCCKCCGSGRDRQTDERPLLSMSMSDYSVGT
jgi:hypothetical protein